MALILLTGHPTSGKSHRANQLYTSFTTLSTTSSPPTSKVYKIDLISDHTLHLPRSAYTSADREKTARATLASAVKRSLSPHTVTIVDSANYIKGFRYQLHCEAKALGIRSSVVHVAVSEAQSRLCNEQRITQLSTTTTSSSSAVNNTDTNADAENARTLNGPNISDPYDPETHTALLARYEEPGQKRWDQPLFVVPPCDAEPPAEKIWATVVQGRLNTTSSTSDATSDAATAPNLHPVRPNAATVLPPRTAASALQTLERETSNVIAQLIARVRSAEGLLDAGGVVELETGAEAAVLEIPAGLQPARLTPPALQRLRRQFIALRRQQMGSQGSGAVGRGRDGGSEGNVGGLFVDWLGDALGGE